MTKQPPPKPPSDPNVRKDAIKKALDGAKRPNGIAPPKKKIAPAAPVDEPAPKKAPVEAPKKAAEKSSLLSVSDVARALGLDPKRARAKLRAAGKSASDGRWAKVRPNSPEHKELVTVLSPEKPDDEETEEVEENGDDE